LHGLAKHGRLITTDRRGWGCSDRFSPSDVAPFEVLAEDLLVVMAAAASDRPVLMATGECSATAAVLASTYPERVTALVLCDPLVAYSTTEDLPGAQTRSEWEEFFAAVRTGYPRPA
jgi:pimeloyl-ACP methyl ester carboxylesterase